MPDWTQVTGPSGTFWAFRIEDGMRVRDVPDDAKCCFEDIPNATPEVAFRNGKFQSVRWVRRMRNGWPEPEYTPLEAGDWLVEIGWVLKGYPADAFDEVAA